MPSKTPYILVLCSLLLSLVAGRVNGDEENYYSSDKLTPNSKHFRLLKGANARARYEYDLLKQVLDSTRQEFGNYQIEHIAYAQGTARGRRELAKGNHFNLNIAPMRPRDISINENIIVIPSPLMKGLLGYRALVTHKEQMGKITKIKTLQDLQEIRIGQARGWLDNKIYRNSGIPVVDNGSYFQLFPMLERQRFELLPLGISEIESALKQNHESNNNNITIVPNLIIYYPFPVVFQVSGNYPGHAKRIELGLKRIKNSGEFDRLFDRHFAKIYRRFLTTETNIVSIENPLLENTLGLSHDALLVYSPAH